MSLVAASDESIHTLNTANICLFKINNRFLDLDLDLQLYLPLVLTNSNANKNQQNTIKILLIISSTQNTRTVNISQFFKLSFQFKDGFTMFNRLGKTIPQ